MSNLRTGKYGGQYYGSYFNESESLTNEQMQLNAIYLYQVLHYIHGWSMNAVAGMLGNMQAESSINPGRWQSDRVGNNNSGYGLVQWTPASKYINWCTSNGYADPSEMDSAIARIIYELEYGEQYYKTPAYNYTFREFSVSTKSPYELACAFAFNYERSWVALYGTEAEKEALRQKRGSYADYWFNYLYENGEGSGEVPIPPDPSTPTYPYHRNKQSFKFVLYASKKRRTKK